MKVLVQYWTPLTGGELVSISKNQEQIQTSILELKLKPDPDWKDSFLNYDDAAEPDGKPTEIEIPDNSPFCDMVEHGTVFLNDDEMSLVWNKNSSAD
ncbi:MAG TPA: hypothetical protein VMR46_04095 [Candidatus Paceibacterota bacterium]|jgi:hypothetical protein|nr:hypothetical protein [Candidatus Paceibacterota bacterium]